MVAPFQMAHLDLFEMRHSELTRLDADPKSLEKMVALANFGVGGTMFHDGRVLAIIGYFELWPGVMEVWAFPSVYVEQYAMIYLRTVKRYVNQILETHSVHRLQTTSLADDVHDRWMMFLGFTCEGTMVKHSVDKRDYRMWARIPEGNP